MRRRLSEWYASAAILWLNACLLFVALNFALALVHARSEPAALGPIRTTIARAHPDLDARSVDALVAESERRLVYDPYTDMTDPPVTGWFVNVDPAGFRRSAGQGPWPPDRANRNVFLFGGSTTFGFGVADEHTIASYLQPLLSEDGRPARVYNFGHSGYYSTQERILFERLLVAGHHPDVAIFVDGLNDFGSPQDEPMNARQLALGFTLAQGSSWTRLASGLPLTMTVRHAARLLGMPFPDHLADVPPLPAWDDPTYLRAVLERYRRSQRAIAGVGAASGVRTVFVWQPVPSYDFPPGADGRWGAAGGIAWARLGYPMMARALADQPDGEGVVWCADVGADGTDAFYVDRVHYAPVMSSRVARCIADGMRAGGREPRPPR